MSNQGTLWNLQILRGFAAIMVLIAHANLIVDKKLFDGILIIGWSGVDFFFILSGFIIYYINHKSIGCKKDFSAYLQKRLVRIYPIYWAYTAITLLLNLLASALFKNGFIHWIKLNFSGIAKSLSLFPLKTVTNEMPILPVAWTLSHEVLFYLMFGFLIFLPIRFSFPIIILWISLIVSNITGLIDPKNPFYYVLSSAKNLEFFAGCLIAHFAIKHTASSKINPIALISSGILLLVLAWENEHSKYITARNLEVISFGIPFALITLGVVMWDKKQPFKPHGSFKKTLVYFGDASYSIYLVHFITIIFISTPLFKIAAMDSITVFLLSTVGSLVAGCIGYSFIEKPILQWMRRKIIKRKSDLIRATV